MVTVKMPDTSLPQICASGQCFRMYKIENDRKHATDNADEYEIIALDRYLRISQSENQPDVITLDCSQTEYEDFWRIYFDTDTDYGYIKSLADDSDPYMQESIKNGSGIRILRQDLWEMIVTFLISQQNNIPRIHKCVENICRTYGKKMTNGLGEDYYAFPTAESLAYLREDALMECNLGYRSKYVVRTAHEIVDGKYDLNAIKNMDYETSRSELLKMYGVGKKVADCICLFALHHIDAFPIDTHIRQIMDREYGGSFPFEKYAGYLGIMQQYIFFNDL